MGRTSKTCATQASTDYRPTLRGEKLIKALTRYQSLPNCREIYVVHESVSVNCLWLTSVTRDKNNVIQNFDINQQEIHVVIPITLLFFL